MKILLLSLVLLFSAFSVTGQEGLVNSLEDEIQKRMEEYQKSNITVAEDILNRYVNDQVMGAILEKQTGSPIRLVNPSDSNMAVLTTGFEECSNSMQRSMRHHQNSILIHQSIFWFDKLFLS